MNRCILGEINEKIYILAKSPKVHKGGGSTPQPIGGYRVDEQNPASLPLFRWNLTHGMDIQSCHVWKES